MPAMDSIGLEYRVDLRKLSSDIKRAKTKINAFHNDLAKLAKKASITITVKGAQKAQQQVKQLSTSMQASLDKVGALKLKLGPESFGRIGGLVPRMTKDYEKLFDKFGKSPALLGRMNDSFKRVNKSLGEQAVRMENSGKAGRKFYSTANRVALVQQELAGNLKATATGIEKVTTASKEAARVTSTTREELRSMGVTSKMTAREIKGLGLRNIDMTRVLDLTKQRMGELKKEVAGGGKSATRAANEYRTLQRRMPELEHEVNKGIKRFGDYRRAMDRWGSGFKYMMASQAAWIASGAVLFGALRLIVQGMRDVIEYHQQMKGLEAITQANAEEMKMMERAINDAAVATKFFAADMSKAATLMAQAGFSADEVANSIGAVAILASATGKSLEDVADLMTTVIRAYDLHASEALRVANVLAAGISESKLQVDTLRTALNYMGVAARQFNISIEDTVAWLGVLRDRGMKASTIGTSFRGVLATLVKETDRFNRVLKDLPEPLGFSDVTIRSGRKLEDAMVRLKDKAFDISDAFIALPRRTAMTFALMVKNVDTFEELRDKITGTNRAVEMNVTMMKGLGSQLKQIKSIFDDIIRSFTEGGGALEPFILLIKMLVQGIGSLLEILGYLTQTAGRALGAILALSEKGFKGLWDVVVRRQKGATDELKAIYKAYQEDINKLSNKLEIDLNRIYNPDIRTTAQKERDDHEETLKALYEKQERLTKSLEKMGKTGTTEWKIMRGELLLVNNLIKDMEEELGMLDDSIKGPVLSLKDAMLDLAVTTAMKAKDILSVFRKGKEDIDLVRKAVELLRKQWEEAYKEAVKFGSKDTEEFKRMMKAAEELIKAEKTLGKLVKQTNKEYYSRQKMIEKLYRKLQRDLRAAHKEWKKEDEFYDKFMSREYPVEFGIQEGLRKFGREIENEYNIWKEMTYDMASALSDTMSDVFFDAMTGELKSMEDYWRAFTNVVKRLIAEMAAQWVLLQGATGVSWLGTLGGGGGMPDINPDIGGPVTAVHEGGLIKAIKRMHAGGLKSGEVLRVLKDKEYVIKDPSVRSLGVSGLDYANRTGQWPQGQTTVVNKNYLSIYAIDSESIDTAIRRGGGKAVNDLSLTAFARARARKDPMVR